MLLDKETWLEQLKKLFYKMHLEKGRVVKCSEFNIPRNYLSLWLCLFWIWFVQCSWFFLVNTIYWTSFLPQTRRIKSGSLACKYIEWERITGSWKVVLWYPIQPHAWRSDECLHMYSRHPQPWNAAWIDNRPKEKRWQVRSKASLLSWHMLEMKL